MLSRGIFFTAAAICTFLLTVSAFADVYPEWINDYAGHPTDGDSYARDCIIDENGSVYVTGKSWLDGREDIVTIKYLTNGTMAWIVRYDHEGIIRSYGKKLIFDDNGDLYVLGGVQNESEVWTYSLVKYSGNGELLLDEIVYPDPPGEYNPWYIDIDFAGNIVIGGSVDDGIFTAKYSPEGSEIWMRRYEREPGTNLFGPGIDLDASGNIYCVAYLHTMEFDGDSYVLKYNADGDLLWETVLGTEDLQYELSRVHSDNLGNIYVLGESNNSMGKHDWLICKLNGDGVLKWTFNYCGDALDIHDDREERICRAITDHSGNLYVTGEGANGENHIDITTIKILPDGTMDWVQQQDGGNQWYDSPSDICLDGAGNVYIAGGVAPPYKSNFDFFVTKLNSAGDVEWTRRYNGAMSGSNWAVSLKADNEENVYAVGHTSNHSADVSATYTTIKYTPSDISLGDVNTDGTTDVGDAVALINMTFRQGDGPDPIEICDANCDSFINIGDILYLINFVFKEGPPCDCMH